MDSYVKVKALNDVDQDVHYRGSATPNTTLCGMRTAPLTTEGPVTCYRCHQFATGDL
ncbi:MAG TPA: hypothetical protein VGZ04_03795 [Acidimicrobiales bacterium]|nr:hypothetical protein [Acidimicrobiales bacterium]